MSDLRVPPDRGPARVARGAPFTFNFDGQPITAYPGETVGAALAAAGVQAFRQTRRQGRPRGLFCGIGVCFDCLVTIDGRINQQACLVPARPGTVVSSAWPALHSSGPAHDRPPATEYPTLETEVAVVGAGPAGLAAAVEAAEAGCRVTVIDAYARPGGQYFKQTPAEFHAVAPQTLHHDFSVAARLLDRLAAAPNAQVLTNTTVWAAQPAAGSHEPTALYLHDSAGMRELRAAAVVLATGAYDRALPFPGWDLPGVMTAGGAQTLVKSQRVLPGRRVLLSGSGPFLMPVAAALAEAGADVVAVCEATTPLAWARHAPRAWGHWDKLGEAAGYLATLRRHRVPLRFGRAVVRAEGDGRVERVALAHLAPDWTPVAGSEDCVEVDAVCVGYGFVPSTELAHALGCAHRYQPVQQAFVVRHDGDMQSSTESVYVAGEVTGIGGSAVALPQGALAGLAAARQVGRLSTAEATALMRPHRATLRHQHAMAALLNDLFALRPGWLEWMEPDTVVCRCEEVTRRQVEQAVHEYQARDVKAVKATTRCGMGPCQGRVCGPTITALTAALSGRSPADVGTFGDRPVARPLPLGDLIRGRE